MALLEQETMTEKISLCPSLICADFLNLGNTIEELDRAHIDMLHIDIIDGHFSPSLPLGLETVKQVRKATRTPLDVHLMVENNQFFVDEMLALGCERICFHLETEKHPDHLINHIKAKGVKAGLALKPSTPVSMLEDIIEICDFVLLMLINPGFAGHSGVTQIGYTHEKIRKCRDLITYKNMTIPIEVDGRISFDNITSLLECGARDFVCGTGTIFRSGFTIGDNAAALDRVIKEWRV